jgi:hypothetical protein
MVNYLSPEWGRVEEWLAEELHETYRRLAGLTVDERETQQLRGRAALLDQMLSFRTLDAAQREAAN